MLLETKVIVSEVTNLHDARYCAGMGVEKIAFPIDPKLGAYIEYDIWKEITEWLSGPAFGAEIHQVGELELDRFQADFFLTTQSELIDKYEAPFVLKITSFEEAKNLIPSYTNKVQFFLLDFEDVQIEDVWTDLKAWASNYKVYVGFGITPDNVKKILSEINPEGIGLKGGKEIKVGLNDFDGLADVLEVIELF